MRAQISMSPDARQVTPRMDAEFIARRAALDLRKLLQLRHQRIAAVIIEPMVQCAAGMAMHHASYLREVRALCNQFDVHLIADEIAVGCGRTGTFFAFEHATVPENTSTVPYGLDKLPPVIWPDFMCLSKGISGGYLPLSLVLARDHIYEAFLDDEVSRGFLHSHSYTGNPLACRAALATLDRFEQADVLVRNRNAAQHLSAALEVLRTDERIEHLRHMGMIWAFDVREEFAGEHFSERFHLAGRERELLIRPIGRTVYLMPPYVLDPPMARWLATRVCETLDAATRERSGATC
jgi:adenosylmethionine-8-amino-7-oxononanoate aminotransferase